MKNSSYDNKYRRPHQSSNNHNYFNHNKRKFGDDRYDNRDNQYQQNYNNTNSFVNNRQIDNNRDGQSHHHQISSSIGHHSRDHFGNEFKFCEKYHNYPQMSRHKTGQWDMNSSTSK